MSLFGHRGQSLGRIEETLSGLRLRPESSLHRSSFFEVDWASTFLGERREHRVLIGNLVRPL